ncbi:MAG: hypothetical protein ACRDSH_13120 [Pseudonocardiaceae bacterium]
MDRTASPARISVLQDQYRHAFTRYQRAKRTADQAEAACTAAVHAREAAHDDEVNAGREVMRAAAALEAASDTAFLTQHGINAG